MSAATQAERSAKTAAKREAVGEEEIRFRALPGTRAALFELMAANDITEIGEAITLMIHHLHALSPARSARLLEAPRHEISISPAVARRLDQACARESLRICSDE